MIRFRIEFCSWLRISEELHRGNKRTRGVSILALLVGLCRVAVT